MVEPIDDLAIKMEEALKAAKANIHPHCLGKSMPLEKDDYKTLGTSIFIERQRQLQEESRQKNRKKNGKKDRTGPPTDPQLGFIARLIEQKQDSHNVVDQFLKNNNAKLVAELNEGQASDLIDLLKAEKDK